MQRVGVTLGLHPSDRYSINSGYSDAVAFLGSLPVFFSSGSALAVGGVSDGSGLENLAIELMSEVDALVVTGGWDVDPSIYGEERSEKVEEIEAVRDYFEIALIRQAVEKGKRVLGICRGIQILNVALGGSLVQDLVSDGYENHSITDKEFEPSHGITLESGVISSFYGSISEVNSLHHQAIRKVAPSLEAVAYSPDGVVEAVEGDNIVGIQWHPERLWRIDPLHLAPFKWVLGAI